MKAHYNIKISISIHCKLVNKGNNDTFVLCVFTCHQRRCTSCLAGSELQTCCPPFEFLRLMVDWLALLQRPPEDLNHPSWSDQTHTLAVDDEKTIIRNMYTYAFRICKHMSMCTLRAVGRPFWAAWPKLRQLLHLRQPLVI